MPILDGNVVTSFPPFKYANIGNQKKNKKQNKTENQQYII
jgi:hypothetical protein